VRGGHLAGELCVLDTRPRELTPAQLGDLLRLADDIRFELELRRATGRLRAVHDAIVSAALDCIITIDATGQVMEFNPAAEATFGYRREEAIGREMSELIVPPHLREAHRRGVARLLATGDPRILNRRVEIEAMRRDGGLFPV
jgi:PAS domain S-box-containing protein